MSEILEKNLSYISKYNPDLCRKVLSISEFEKDFDIRPNLSGDYNLIVNGKAVHSISNAQEEAELIYNQLPHDSANSLHVIYGLGLGYLLDVFAEKAKGTIIVFESDIESLRLVLEAVDFSKNFETKSIYFASDLKEFESVFALSFRYKTRASLSCLDYHKFQCSREFNIFKKEFERQFDIWNFNFTFQVNEAYSFLIATAYGLSDKYLTPFLTDYKDLFKGLPAIIVSAGPSLHKNIETLKKYKDNAVIFSVGTAYRTLDMNGVTPDFLNVIERNNTRLHYDMPSSKDVTIITEPFTEPSTFKVDFKRRFITSSLETDASRWFLNCADKELIEFETKGTVSYHALSCARYLGCNPIILLGQDLAYTDGKCYAAGSSFDDLECVKDEKSGEYSIRPKNFESYMNAYCASQNWTEDYKRSFTEGQIKELNKEIKFVDGQNGEKMPTNSGYALFIEYIKDFAKKHADSTRLINSSLGGALIEGFETVSLEDAMAKFDNIKDVKESLWNSIERKPSCNLLKTGKKLMNELEIFDSVKALFEKGKKIITNLKPEITKSKIYTNRISELLGAAAEVYVEITNKYTNPNTLLKIIVMKENHEIMYLMKNTEENMKIEHAVKLYEVLSNYFLNIPPKLVEAYAYIHKAAKDLEAYESSYTKS